MKPYYQEGTVTIYHGDCCEVLPQLPRGDLIFADPPFNTGKDYGTYKDNLPIGDYYDWCQDWIEKCFCNLLLTGSFYVYTNSRHLSRLQIIMDKYGIWQNTIVWHYTNPTPDSRRYPKTWSAFLFFTKTGEYTFNKDAILVRPFQTNLDIPSTVKQSRLYDVWYDVSKLVGGYVAQKEVILKPNTKQRECVYQLPRELLWRIILTSSNERGLIIDPFLHSGTSAVVAKELGRKFIGCEIDERYCEIVANRCRQAVMSLST